MNKIISLSILITQLLNSIPAQALQKERTSILSMPAGKEDWSRLHWAARAGNLADTLFLLNNEADTNKLSRNGDTPLKLAIEFGHKKIVSLLLAFGANPNSIGFNGETALHTAIDMDRVDIVELLLSAGANPNIHFPDGASTLYAAVCRDQPEIVNLLITASVNLDTQNPAGETALWAAADRVKTASLKLLLAAGANTEIPHATNHTTPLIIAAARGNAEAVAALIAARADLYATERGGLTALRIAADEGHTDIVRLLLEASVTIHQLDLFEDSTACDYASQRDYEMAELLANAGATTNLLISEPKNQKALLCEVRNGSLEGVRGFLNNETDINYVSFSLEGALPPFTPAAGEEQTPLILAAKHGHENIIRLLLDSGADVNRTGELGETALHVAMRQGHIAIVQQLLCAGANPNILFSNGESTLCSAVRCDQPEIVDLLIGASVKLNINMQNPADGETALFKASCHGKTGMVTSLLAAKADTELPATASHATPLLVAATHGHIETVKALIEANANIYASDSRGLTPLHAAAQQGHIEIVKMLAAEGVPLDLPCRFSERTPLLLAIEMHQTTMAQFLRDAGVKNTPIADKRGRLALKRRNLALIKLLKNEKKRSAKQAELEKSDKKRVGSAD